MKKTIGLLTLLSLGLGVVSHSSASASCVPAYLDSIESSKAFMGRFAPGHNRTYKTYKKRLGSKKEARAHTAAKAPYIAAKESLKTLGVPLTAPFITGKSVKLRSETKAFRVLSWAHYRMNSTETNQNYYDVAFKKKEIGKFEKEFNKFSKRTEKKMAKRHGISSMSDLDLAAMIVAADTDDSFCLGEEPDSYGIFAEKVELQALTSLRTNMESSEDSNKVSDDSSDKIDTSSNDVGDGEV